MKTQTNYLYYPFIVLFSLYYHSDNPARQLLRKTNGIFRHSFFALQHNLDIRRRKLDAL